MGYGGKVPGEGLEPSLLASLAPCLLPLGYPGVSTPGRICTRDFRVRSAALYSTELQGLTNGIVGSAYEIPHVDGEIEEDQIDESEQLAHY